MGFWEWLDGATDDADGVIETIGAIGDAIRGTPDDPATANQARDEASGGSSPVGGNTGLLVSNRPWQLGFPSGSTAPTTTAAAGGGGGGGGGGVDFVLFGIGLLAVAGVSLFLWRR